MLTSLSSPSQLSVSVVNNHVNFIVMDAEDRKDLTPKSENAYKIEITNSATGQVVYSGVMTGETLSVNASGWKPGIYIVNSINGDESVSQKFTIK